MIIPVEDDPIPFLKPGDLIPVMVEVVKIVGGNIWFKSDDGTLAYRRYQDVRDALHSVTAYVRDAHGDL